MKRVFLALSGLLVAAAPALAQPPAAAGQPTTIAVAIQRGYNNVKMNLVQMVDKVSDADYGSKPGTLPEIRNFGQLLRTSRRLSSDLRRRQGRAEPEMGRSSSPSSRPRLNSCQGAQRLLHLLR